MAVPENNPQTKMLNQTISYWKIIRILLSRWYWIAGAVFIGFIIAFLVIKYTAPIYYTQASLKLDNGEQTQLASPTAPMAYRYPRSNIIETEGIILRSPEVVMKAIQQLDYKVSYFLEGRVRTTEVYPNVPFAIHILSQDSTGFSKELFEVKAVNASSFRVFPKDRPSNVRYPYKTPITLGGTTFSIESEIPKTGNYSFRFNSPEDFYYRAVNGLGVDEVDKNTNIMRVSHTDENPRFSADVVNAIIKQYLANDAEQKKRSAIQTIDYLDDQINYLDTVVQKSGDNLTSFQTTNSSIDPLTDKAISAQQLADYKSSLNQLEIELIKVRQLESQLAGSGQNPINLNLEGSSNTVLAGLVIEYNDLLQDRIAKRETFGQGNPVIKELDDQIAEKKRAISANIRGIRVTNERAKAFFMGKLSGVNANLNKLPTTQNLFNKLQNKYDVNQKLYSMLFERKLAAQITRAAVIPGATIIAHAEVATGPISPIERKVYIQYMFLGLVVGLGMIVLVRILNPFIYDVETVEGLTTTPIIGVILKYPEKIDSDFKKILSLEKPKSVFAESVRSVRTNLSFMASQSETKIICVTSEISGEGKSFVTVNLAGTMAIIDKKVIVIAADLRRSKLHKTFGSDNKKGLSTYLSSKDSIDDIIFKDALHDIDYITSGPVPPNPSELLHSPLMDALLENLKAKYEYIIIDTAPVGLVSDSIPLIRKADINLFIIRSGVSKFRAATIPDRLGKEYGLNNIAIILNSFDDEKLHSNIYSTNYATSNTGTYYYSDYTGYGNYGYYDEGKRKKWWQIWK